MKIEIKQLVEDWVNEALEDGPQECILDGAWYNLIKVTLENAGYNLSSDPECLDDVMYTNSWEYDYYQYILKDGKYTGYVLVGSLYFGQHRIEKDETDRI